MTGGNRKKAVPHDAAVAESSWNRQKGILAFGLLLIAAEIAGAFALWYLSQADVFLAQTGCTPTSSPMCTAVWSTYSNGGTFWAVLFGVLVLSAVVVLFRLRREAPRSQE